MTASQGYSWKIPGRSYRAERLSPHAILIVTEDPESRWFLDLKASTSFPASLLILWVNGHNWWHMLVTLAAIDGDIERWTNPEPQYCVGGDVIMHLALRKLRTRNLNLCWAFRNNALQRMFPVRKKRTDWNAIETELPLMMTIWRW